MAIDTEAKHGAPLDAPNQEPADDLSNEDALEGEKDAGFLSRRTKIYAIITGIVLVIAFVALTVGLYMLGGDDQSALERLRDIAVIYIVVMSLLIVIVLAASTAALIYLIMQIQGRVIPLLEELNETMIRVRGTTEFMSDQAVKPVINAAGKVAQARAMWRVATGREPK